MARAGDIVALLFSAVGITLFHIGSSRGASGASGLQGELAAAAGVDGDDECLAADPGAAGCALSALQRRSFKVGAGATAGSEGSAVLDGASEAAARVEHNNAELAALGVHFNSSGMAHDLMAMGPPPSALDYDGMAWPNMVVSGSGAHHIFAIGDWGGMDGSFEPGHGHHRIIAYPGGHTREPHVFPRTRWNKAHSYLLCDHKAFVACYSTHGGWGCDPRCGYVEGVDDKAQVLVAAAFNRRAGTSQPKFVLNVGDNFYWGGLEVDCGTPMGASSLAQTHQFDVIFNSVYSGSVPWLSALGNHDWGGFRFTNGWDQQIAYTWKSGRWVMPASYYSQHVDFPDSGFSVDVYVMDSNHEDAKTPSQDTEHNICSTHNKPDASCPGGPSSLGECKDWFHSRWAKQQQWLAEKLGQSTADWQIVVTHFPCGLEPAFFRRMHSDYGLDLLVTGHRHDQELWDPRRLGGLTCFVTGGGGGISSEATPNPMDKSNWYGEAQYGFYDLTISKEKLYIESVNYDGTVVKTAIVYPKAGSAAGAAAAGPSPTTGSPAPGSPAPAPPSEPAGPSCKEIGCGKYIKANSCQCNSRCSHYHNCCGDYQSVCHHHG
mmetsp:Transcript_130469/g.363523  ORF Transcript_130469/g.363523 Transcript_130469/m.363523 type:complete len:602 (+) Transcript_130469:65-1870(+)